ncbi:hypothetical protein LCGC14_1356440 [marine sediment metagenome]|uniref:Uncharacterized protein n=1 Tax=marine sediment metagenome TaxID=412755 RepID=A0A0F9KA30_9ZZZZ
MRNSLSIHYYCDVENCYSDTRVWEENRRWLGYDLKSQKVFLRECGFPLPPTWTIIGDQHFCPNHNIFIHGETPLGENVEITRTGGLYEPVKEREEEILGELKKAEERDDKLSNTPPKRGKHTNTSDGYCEICRPAKK